MTTKLHDRLGAAWVRQHAARARVRRIEALLCRAEDQYGALAFMKRQTQLVAAKEDAWLEYLAASREVVAAADDAGECPFARDDIDRAFSHSNKPMFARGRA